ncbi:coatomer subunit beta-1-like, partial [Trifolium medium]|nr:coatomer subunit beta-1-like [Trifolium medium]
EARNSADGTYATQSAALETATCYPCTMLVVFNWNLTSLMLSGDFILGEVVAGTLTMLILRLKEVQTSKVEVNKETSDRTHYEKVPDR